LGKPLPATLLFDYPTLIEVAGHIQHLLGPDVSPGEAPETNETSRLQNLDDDAAAVLIAAEAARLGKNDKRP
jgi:hypothetical protein